MNKVNYIKRILFTTGIIAITFLSKETANAQEIQQESQCIVKAHTEWSWQYLVPVTVCNNTGNRWCAIPCKIKKVED